MAARHGQKGIERNESTEEKQKERSERRGNTDREKVPSEKNEEKGKKAKEKMRVERQKKKKGETGTTEGGVERQRNKQISKQGEGEGGKEDRALKTLNENFYSDDENDQKE